MTRNQEVKEAKASIWVLRFITYLTYFGDSLCICDMNETLSHTKVCPLSVIVCLNVCLSFDIDD